MENETTKASCAFLLLLPLPSLSSSSVCVRERAYSREHSLPKKKMRKDAEAEDKETASRRGGGIAASTSYLRERDAGQQNAAPAAFAHKSTRFAAPRAGGDVKVRLFDLDALLSPTLVTSTHFSHSLTLSLAPLLLPLLPLFKKKKNTSSVSSPTRRERRTRRSWRAREGEASARRSMPLQQQRPIAPPRRQRRRRRSTSTLTTKPGDDRDTLRPPRRPRRPLPSADESSGRHKKKNKKNWRRP